MRSAAFCQWLARNAQALLAVICCGLAPAIAAELSIAVAGTPLSLPIFVAENQGFFREEGLKIQLLPVTGGHLAMKEVLEGRADVGTASDSVLMFNSLNRDDFVTLGYFVRSPSDLSILAREETPLTPEAWQGKTIGVVKGSSSEYLMHSWFLRNGIDPQSVRLLDIKPSTMVEALAQQKVAAVSIWEPIAFNIRQQVAGSTELSSSGMHTLTFHLLTLRETSRSRAKDLQAMLRAIDQAESFIRQNPQRAQIILQDSLKVDWAFIDWIWPRYHFQLGLDQALISSLESQARWSMENGLTTLEQVPNYLHFIDSQPMRAVRSDAVSLIE